MTRLAILAAVLVAVAAMTLHAVWVATQTLTVPNGLVAVLAAAVFIACGGLVKSTQ